MVFLQSGSLFSSDPFFLFRLPPSRIDSHKRTSLIPVESGPGTFTNRLPAGHLRPYPGPNLLRSILCCPGQALAAAGFDINIRSSVVGQQVQFFVEQDRGYVDSTGGYVDSTYGRHVAARANGRKAV